MIDPPPLDCPPQSLENTQSTKRQTWCDSAGATNHASFSSGAGVNSISYLRSRRPLSSAASAPQSMGALASSLEAAERDSYKRPDDGTNAMTKVGQNRGDLRQGGGWDCLQQPLLLRGKLKNLPVGHSVDSVMEEHVHELRTVRGFRIPLLLRSCGDKVRSALCLYRLLERYKLECLCGHFISFAAL